MADKGPKGASSPCGEALTCLGHLAGEDPLIQEACALDVGSLESGRFQELRIIQCEREADQCFQAFADATMTKLEKEHLRNAIMIVPLGDSFDGPVLDLFEQHLQVYCEAFFDGFKVEWLPKSCGGSMSLDSFAPAENMWGHRLYRASDLAAVLRGFDSTAKQMNCHLVGVTLEDMCTPWSAKHELTMPGVTLLDKSLVSFATVCPTFRSAEGTPAAPHLDERGFMTSAMDIVTNAEKAMWVLQSLRITTHEICHILGLRHCLHFQCLMNPGDQRSDDLGGGMFLCPICLRKLRFALCMSGVEPSAPVERYEAMLKALHLIEDECAGNAEPAAAASQSFLKTSAGVRRRRKDIRRRRKDKLYPDPESTSSSMRKAIVWLEQRLMRLGQRRGGGLGGA